MIPVPAWWLDAASTTHRPQWTAEVLGTAGQLLAVLPITAGQLTRAEGSAPRVAANVDLPSQPQPQRLDQQYLPTGIRLRLRYRIGEAGWVTMADLDVEATALSRPDDTWTMAAADRSQRVSDDGLVRTGAPAIAGLTVSDAVALLVRRTFPGTTVNATGPATTQRVPDSYNEDQPDGSPWQLAEALCAEAQSEVYYDADRAVRVRPIPSIGTPVDTLTVGPTGNVSAYVVRHELTVNSVALRYTGTEGQLLRLGTAEDRRPTSPAAIQRIGSHIVAGSVIRAETAPTQAEANAAAAALLTREGRPRSVELSHPPRPWIEPGDTVEVSFLGGPTEPQVVESVGIDLSNGATQVTRLRNHDYRMDTEVP